MYNVYVIFTQHKAEGNINSNELLKIIESIQPDVIFEEILYVVYDQVYVQQNRPKLESEAVKAYLMTNDLELIPVDTFEPPDGYYNSQNHLLEVLGRNIYKSVRHNNAFTNLINSSTAGGFPFLNSDENDILLNDLENEQNQHLAELGDDNLNQIAALRNEVNSKRDEEMIDNIYKYGEQNEFRTGILLIGAGHRRSIKSKLDKIEPRYGVEIKWHFLGRSVRSSGDENILDSSLKT